MPVPPTLAYVEHCLPGDARQRLRLARRHGLALEVANREGLDVELVARSGVPVATVQAYRMHDLHPLHPDPERRRAAAAHLRDSIELAHRLGAPRVLAVCGFGHEPCDAPFERCRDFFAAAAPFAAGRGVRLLLEPLSRRRAGAMTGRAEIERLLDELADPERFAVALDTGHVLDDGGDPVVALAAWRHPVEEVQLRDRGSRPPSPALPLAAWLAAPPAPPAVIAVEHREPIDPDRLGRLVAALRAAAPGAR